MPCRLTRAGVAQLVEYELPKLGVAGSNPVARSKPSPGQPRDDIALQEEPMGIFGKPTDNKPPDPPVPDRPRAAASRCCCARRPHAPAASAAQAVRTSLPTLCVLGAKTTIKGEMLGDEDVVIEGTVEGQIRIGRELRVEPAAARCARPSPRQSVVVSGEMQRRLRAPHPRRDQATGRLIGQHPRAHDRDRGRGRLPGQQRHVGPQRPRQAADS